MHTGQSAQIDFASSADDTTPAEPTTELPDIRVVSVFHDADKDRLGVVHGIVGENGAGKSTLMKIIYGAVHPDAGEVRFNGQLVDIRGPQQARALGISMVFQHFSLFDTLSVAENVALAAGWPVDPAALRERVRALAAEHGGRTPAVALTDGYQLQFEVGVVFCLAGALAAILLHTGYKLAHPSILRGMIRLGRSQWIP